MHLLWIAPAGLAGAGLLVGLAFVAQLAEQARGLRRDMERFSDLRPALIALRDASEEARRTAEALRHR